MVETASEMQKAFNDATKYAAMAMLVLKLFVVGSMPERSRAGTVQEIDMMMELGGFKHEYLEQTDSATRLRLSKNGIEFFRK